MIGRRIAPGAVSPAAITTALVEEASVLQRTWQQSEQLCPQSVRRHRQDVL
jgi:hypothetical protein